MTHNPEGNPAAAPPSRLAHEAVATEDGPHPRAELGSRRRQARASSFSPAVPIACGSQQSGPRPRLRRQHQAGVIDKRCSTHLPHRARQGDDAIARDSGLGGWPGPRPGLGRMHYWPQRPAACLHASCNIVSPSSAGKPATAAHRTASWLVHPGRDRGPAGP